MRDLDLVVLQQVYLQSREHVGWAKPANPGSADFIKDISGERVWVAELEGQVVGLISAWTPENYIHHLYVSPQFFRRGIGSRLLDSCMEHLGRPARLKCLSENAIALQFYKSKGWQTIAFGNGVDGEYEIMQYK